MLFYCLLQVKTERAFSGLRHVVLLLATSEDRESALKSSTCCLYCSLQVKTERAFSSSRHVVYCLLQVKTERALSSLRQVVSTARYKRRQRERSQVLDMLSLLLATSEDSESVLKSSTCCLYCVLQVKTERALSSLRHVVSTARYK